MPCARPLLIVGRLCEIWLTPWRHLPPVSELQRRSGLMPCSTGSGVPDDVTRTAPRVPLVKSGVLAGFEPGCHLARPTLSRARPESHWQASFSCCFLGRYPKSPLVANSKGRPYWSLERGVFPPRRSTPKLDSNVNVGAAWTSADVPLRPLSEGSRQWVGLLGNWYWSALPTALYAKLLVQFFMATAAGARLNLTFCSLSRLGSLPLPSGRCEIQI